MVQDGVGVIYLFVGKFLQLYDQKKTLLHDIQFGGSQVISSGSVAAFQPLSLPFPLILDLHPGGKNPDSNGIEMKVLKVHCVHEGFYCSNCFAHGLRLQVQSPAFEEVCSQRRVCHLV